MKKVIGIDIDHVLRDTFEGIRRKYNQEFEESQIDEYEVFTSHLINENFKFPETSRQYTEVESNNEYLIKFPKTYSVNDKFSPQETMENFIYSDYLVEIFGSSPMTLRNLSFVLNNLYNNGGEFSIKIISKISNIKEISPTLHFLSTIPIHYSSFQFLNTNENVFDYCDVYVTANPNIESNDGDKKLIKVKRLFNKNLKANLEINNIDELNIEKIKTLWN